jgi:hypothetical protein
MNGKTAKSGFDRRTLIKGGVAAGVAGAAWASPTIRSARVVALDNSACTVPIIEYFSDDAETNQNSACSTGVPLVEYLVYGSSGNSPATVDIRNSLNVKVGTLTVNTDNPLAGLPANPAGIRRCSALPGPSYTIVLDTPGLTCSVAEVEIIRQSDKEVITSAAAVVVGKMPPIPKGNIDASARFRASIIECCPTANYHP